MSQKESLHNNADELIRSLNLSDREKDFIFSNWQVTIVYAKHHAAQIIALYRFLILITITSSVVSPILFSLNFIPTFEPTFHLIAVILSLLVAISVTSQYFFRYQEKARIYSELARMLELEGQRYFAKVGSYASLQEDEGFRLFAERVIAIKAEEGASYQMPL